MEAVTAGIIGTVLGGISGSICTYYCSRNLFREQRRHEVMTKFHVAFFDEIIICNGDPSHDSEGVRISSVIESAINKHEKAVLMFRPFVSACDLSGFNKAWEEYSCNNKRSEMHAKYKSHDHESVTFEATSEKEMRHTVLSRINKLPKFEPLK